MSGKLVVPRERASRDIDEAIQHYLDDAGDKVALGFIDALERAFRHISRYPGAGSSRYGQELALPELRFQTLKRYPYLVFYVEQADHLDVWRVLHTKRDIPAWLAQAHDI